MKALSLKQPWAELIASGKKPIETRTWSTRYRGRLLIVASTRLDRIALARFPYYYLPMGVAICLTELVDCRPMTSADEVGACCPCEPGRFAWILTNVQRVKPVKVKGRLGLFDLYVGVNIEPGFKIETVT